MKGTRVPVVKGHEPTRRQVDGVPCMSAAIEVLGLASCHSVQGKSRYVSQASLTHITGNPWCLRWMPTMEIPGIPLLKIQSENKAKQSERIPVIPRVTHTHTHASANCVTASQFGECCTGWYDVSVTRMTFSCHSACQHGTVCNFQDQCLQ